MHFQKDSEFTRELKAEVKALLANDSNGRFADTRVWVKAVALIAICAGLYLAILLADLGDWQRYLLTGIYAFMTLLLGLNVMHEGAHGNFSRIPALNTIFALTFDVHGISSDLYKTKHIQFHHNYTNQFGLDGDISETPLIRMSESQPWLKIHRYQAWFTPLLYSLITASWPLFDLMRLIDCKVSGISFKRPSLFITTRILAFKALNIYLTYVLPIKLLGADTAVPLILGFHLGLGFFLALIFQVAHVQSASSLGTNAEATDWHVHQLLTSADFGTRSKRFNFIMGGLNFQTLHHLFPQVSYRHFPEIQKIVLKLCRKHGYHYVHYRNFRTAVVAHWEFLNRLAQKPAVISVDANETSPSPLPGESKLRA